MTNTMRHLLHTIALAIIALHLGGCTAMMNTSFGSNDLYRNDNRAEIQAAEQARMQRRTEPVKLDRSAYYNSDSEASSSYSSIVADDYQSAYARRLQGFNSPTYKLPSSYYSYETMDAMRYATVYDPAYYNIMVSGDQVWVEPKYITSMFGAWGATNVTYGIYSSPWMYGWNIYVDPFFHTWWGYPHYSWYDWNWNICYNPFFWGPGFYPGLYPYYPGYPGYYPHPIYPPRPPHPGHGPSIHPGGSGNRPNMNGDRRHSASRYTSPTSNKNYGGGTHNMNGGSGSGRGAVSTGINNSKSRTTVTNRGYNSNNANHGNATVRPSQQQSHERSNSNFRQSTTRGNNYNTGSSFRGGSSSGVRGGGGGFSGGRTGGGTSSRR